jgi:transcriptional regulator with XRE-family HTH domain
VTRYPLVLADRLRAEQFHLLGRTRRLFGNYSMVQDANGVAWAIRKIAGHCFGLTWLGSGWVFDPYAQGQWAADLHCRQQRMRQASPEQHQAEFAKIVKELRLGILAERLIWAIHQRLLTARTSVFVTADLWLGQAVWGQHRAAWPRNWRCNLEAILQTLCWLHVAAQPDDNNPDFDAGTALLTHAAHLGASRTNCRLDCSHRGGPAHHHFLINVGRGFLGVLEHFASDGDGPGCRNYQFPRRSRRKAIVTLHRLGKLGSLTSIFLPAKLGMPAMCRRLSPDQHRLLQAIVRETTRPREPRQSEDDGVALIRGGRIPDLRGRRLLECPLLPAENNYVCFGGNGTRKGLGYRLLTPGGWLAKAGYQAHELATFIADMATVQNMFGLIGLGLVPASEEFLDLDQIRALARTEAGRRTLEPIHFRTYAQDGYVARWSALFAWQADTGTNSAEVGAGKASDLVKLLHSQNLNQRALAEGIGIDPSYLSKILNGKKPCPLAIAAKARAYIVTQKAAPPPHRPTEVRSPTPVGSLNQSGDVTDDMLDAALAYHRRGWAIVPQRAGAKQPLVRWKPYQDRRPTAEEIRHWWQLWPLAGMAVVLGPVSDLFVIDVDGTEAHEVLVDRLNGLPLAPQALSGSGQPHRYHLFFRCPAIATQAKTTPWHPQLEFRGAKGIVILPPSLHKSGHRYAWAEGKSPDYLALPDVPAPILEALADQQGRPPRRHPPAGNEPLEELPLDFDCSPTTRRFLAGEFAKGPNWNDMLFRAACDLAGRGIPLEDAEPRLLAGAKPWNSSEEDNARRTIQSAYGTPREPARF